MGDTPDDSRPRARPHAQKSALTRPAARCYAGDMLYFAYGANMSRAAMRRRCPGARAIGPAALAGYRFFVGLEGWGSVKPARGDTVHGVLWRLTPRDLAALHAYELLHKGLYEVRHLPVRLGARSLPALVYLLRRRRAGKPKPGYVEMIAAAARDWQLPEAYIGTVERWSVSRFTGGREIDVGEIA
jgi:cation transport regulator ChaC